MFRQSARQCLFFVQNGGSVYTKGAVSAFSNLRSIASIMFGSITQYGGLAMDHVSSTMLDLEDWEGN